MRSRTSRARNLYNMCNSAASGNAKQACEIANELSPFPLFDVTPSDAHQSLQHGYDRRATARQSRLLVLCPLWKYYAVMDDS